MRPELQAIDWAIIGGYGVFALALGSFFTKQASRGVESFFVGDRKLPWWLAGTSMVATTFAADTPLAVTGLVATGGIAGNWIWWCWAIAHVVATFLFARLWRRSGVITDAEITELRYSGRAAAALRGFKAVYWGVFVNCLTMAWVIAAMVKISAAFFDFSPALVITVCVGFAVAYTTLGGFRSVVITDLVQFCLGMGGAIVLAWLVVDHFGGIGEATANGAGLLAALAQNTAAAGRDVGAVLDFVPNADHPTTPLALFVVFVIAGWWRYAEGNGYIVQRLAACRDEGQAQGASLWFAVAHNALRPWPWIIVGLAALVFYPQFAGDAQPSLTAGDITVSPGRIDVVTGAELTLTGVAAGATVAILDQQAVAVATRDGAVTARFAPFAQSAVATVRVSAGDTVTTIDGMRIELVDREMGYPLLMGRMLPTGILGLVIASLLAAFMSTIDTHTNWGASYLVRDLYQRFIRPDASERHYVMVSRLCILLMAILAGLTALIIHNIADVWRFLLTLGAGLGSVTAARWYWHRVTAYAEFAAIGVTTILGFALLLLCTPKLFGGDNPLFIFPVTAWAQILIIAGASLSAWIPVALFGPQNDAATLRTFADRVRPSGPGWSGIGSQPGDPVGPALLRCVAGLGVIYGTLFGLGDILLGDALAGSLMLGAAAILLAWIISSGRAPSSAS